MVEEEELQGEEKIKVMIEALKSSQLFVRSTATEQLTVDIIENPNFVLPIVVKEMADPEWWTVRFGITEAIQEAAVRGLEIPEVFVKQVLDYLNDDDVEYRAKLALCLGDIKNPLAVTPLINVMSTDNDELRENAALSLGKLKDASALPVLFTHLSSDASEYVQTACIMSIGEISENKKKEMDIKDIVKMLRNENSSIQTETAIALGKILNPACIVPLIKSMNPSRRDLTAESRQRMLDTLNLFTEQEILAEIQSSSKDDENLYLDLLDEALFQNPYELLKAESDTLKEKLISKYQRQFKRVKNEIDGINAFVADVFSKLAKINDKEEIETIKDTIPRKRNNLEKIEVSKIATYAWVHNSLYLELKDAEKNFQLGISALFELESAVDAKLGKLTHAE